MKALLLIALLPICNILSGQVTIKGTVKHAKDSVIVFKETDGFTNITRTWRDKRYKAIIDKNNRFTITLPEQDINRWLIETENGYQFFDLAKGKNMELVADFSWVKPLKAIGENADDFNYLTYVSGRNKPDKSYQKRIRSKNIDSVLFWRKQMAVRNIQLLDQYKRAHNMSDVYYNWIKSKYMYEPYERTGVENIDNKDSISSTALSKLLEPGINSDYAALNTREYNDLVEVYIRKKFMDAAIEYTPHAYFTLATDLLQAKTRDVCLTRFTARFIQTVDSIYNPVYEKYNELVKDSALKNYIVRERNDYLDLQKQKGENISQYSSLNEIFGKYKGRVMYVDFWASWCIPCRGEMPNAAALKKQLSGKDVVFVYLGYRDTEKAWLKAREDLDIQGEHYLLSNKLIKEAEEAFNISGIPHYVIIDKAGNIVNKRAERPGFVYRQLSGLINKE
ncbi:MAG: TlpA family protein disulfide reductase [Chitinophagaceae bacterium]|nr:TlpA family protein disulfide reductase [Chitinophagaceae bacterium]